MNRPLAAAPLLAALALAGCNTGFEPQYRVKDLRLLALRATVQGTSFADATPGDTLVLDALVANPLGRPGLTVSWFGCFPEANESLPPCAELSSLDDPAKLATDPRVVPLGTGETVTLPLEPATVGSALSFVVDVALEDPAFQCRLYADLVVVAVAVAQDRRAMALKRVRVTPRPEDLAGTGLEEAYVLNLDPRILEVARAPADRATCQGGTAVGGGPFPRGQTVLCGTAASGSVQTFNVCRPDGAREPETEDLSWQWYVTDGEFPEFSGIGNANGGDVEFTRPAGAFTLWAILRDGRGGEDWATFAVPAAP